MSPFTSASGTPTSTPSSLTAADASYGNSANRCATSARQKTLAQATVMKDYDAEQMRKVQHVKVKVGSGSLTY